MLNVADFGAVGDGLTDDTPAIAAALAAVTGEGGEVRFPGRHYRITASIRPKSGTRVVGENARLSCPDTGWALVPTVGYGLINFDNKQSASIDGMHLYGTKVADQNHTPKLIYIENSTHITVEDCELENTAFEGIWQGGSAELNKCLRFQGIYAHNVGYPAAGFAGLPAIQLNATDSIVADCILQDVGTAIGSSGSRNIVSGNRISGVQVCGIGVGDGANSVGNIITGNDVEIASSNTYARSAYKLGSGVGADASQLLLVQGNMARVVGAAGDSPARGFWATGASHVALTGNAVEIEGRGSAVEVLGTPAGVTAFLTANVVRIRNEVAACYGFAGVPNGAGKSLQITSRDNAVYGLTRALGSYAFDFNANGGGSLDARMFDDWMTEGNLRIGGASYGAGQFDRQPIRLPS